MRLFARLFSRPPVTRAATARRPAARLGLEVLEDRMVLNNRFVVPVGFPVDNFANFATLSSAMTTAGLITGDIIQIEPGATPGNVVNANFTTAFATATVLTIKGDDAVSASAIPQFTVSDATTIAANRTLNLDNANLGLITAGALTFNGNTNISDSILVDINSSAARALTFAGTVDNLTNCTVVNNTTVSDALVFITTNAAGTSHLISGNTFVSNAATNCQVAWNGGSGVAVTDLLTNNTFSTSPGATTNFSIVIQESISGLVIQNNRFSGPVSTGILQITNPTNLQILNNSIDLNAAASTGISMSNGTGTTSGTIANNVIKTNGTGTGLLFSVGALGAMNLKVQGNDFHSNKIGVQVIAGFNSVANVDLGGGTQGSLGGNNFRGYTAAATAAAGAITTNSTTGIMAAKSNIFSVPNPQTVIYRSGAGTVNTTGQLTGNAATVANLYNDLLHRAGNTALPADAGNWVTFLNNGGSLASVASAIGRSPEALGVIVDGLYQKVLGRAADAGGRANFVTFLQTQTVEQAIVEMTKSVEFNTLAGTDGGFVLALYGRLLGRLRQCE